MGVPRVEMHCGQNLHSMTRFNRSKCGAFLTLQHPHAGRSTLIGDELIDTTG